jgi:hypothetical protein
MKNWIAVASADHVAIGRREGIMQVCHGKGGPLRRIRPGDAVAYYSPALFMRRADGLQSFTALGVVKDRAPYQFDMGGGFVPFRRDVTWFDTRDAPIRPLLEALEFTHGKQNWGYQFRYGLFEIGHADMRRIADAMGVGAQHLQSTSSTLSGPPPLTLWASEASMN